MSNVAAIIARAVVIWVAVFSICTLAAVVSGISQDFAWFLAIVVSCALVALLNQHRL